jgi:hypothetical protein
MFRIRTQSALLIGSLFFMASALPASAQVVGSQRVGILPPVSLPRPPPDNSLLTTYSFDNAYTSAYYSVCGSLPGSEGCYGGGLLGPFGHAGALIEGNESVQGTVVKRNIYVIDDKAGGTTVKLYVYQKTDTIKGADDSIATSLVNTISLPLIGGAGAKTYMAGDDNFLFIGTSLSQSAVKVAKSDLSFQTLGGFSGPAPIYVSSATSNKYGSITVTFSDSSGVYTGFYSFDPNGNFSEDGGGADYLLGTSTALTTANLLTSTNSTVTNRKLPSLQRNVRFYATEQNAASGH